MHFPTIQVSAHKNAFLFGVAWFSIPFVGPQGFQKGLPVVILHFFFWNVALYFGRAIPNKAR